MTIPGLFVEYLINGGVALLWIYPLLKDYLLTDIPSSYLPLYAIGLYVVGMVIDIVAWVITRPIKGWIREYTVRERIQKRHGYVPLSIYSSSTRQIKIALYAPEVAKENTMRSSRDRIARGAIINSIMATIFRLPFYVGLIVILLSLGMWMLFEGQSFSYEIIAEHLIDEKNSLLKNKSGLDEPKG
jgi:hypothetical protein